MSFLGENAGMVRKVVFDSWTNKLPGNSLPLGG